MRTALAGKSKQRKIELLLERVLNFCFVEIEGGWAQNLAIKGGAVVVSKFCEKISMVHILAQRYSMTSLLTPLRAEVLEYKQADRRG